MGHRSLEKALRAGRAHSQGGGAGLERGLRVFWVKGQAYPAAGYADAAPAC